MSVRATASEAVFPGQGMLGDALEDMTGNTDITDTEITGVEELTDIEEMVQEEGLAAAVPATGDSSGLLLWVCVAAGAGITLAWYRLKRKKLN